jgi:hypothetical protein
MLAYIYIYCEAFNSIFVLVHPYMKIYMGDLSSYYLEFFFSLEVSYLEIFGLFYDVVRKMDKSWMKLP